MSEMNLTFGTNCSGLDMQLFLNGSGDILCTGNNLVFANYYRFSLHLIILPCYAISHVISKMRF